MKIERSTKRGQTISSSPIFSPCPAAQTCCPTADMTDFKGIPKLLRAITCCQTHTSAKTRTLIGLGLCCMDAPTQTNPSWPAAHWHHWMSSVAFPASSKFREQKKAKPNWKVYALLLDQATNINYSSSRSVKMAMPCNSQTPSSGVGRNRE